MGEKELKGFVASNGSAFSKAKDIGLLGFIIIAILLYSMGWFQKPNNESLNKIEQRISAVGDSVNTMNRRLMLVEYRLQKLEK